MDIKNPHFRQAIENLSDYAQNEFVGPITKSMCNDFIFGIDNTGNHRGYVGWEFVKTCMFNKELDNTYHLSYTKGNIPDDIVEYWTKKSIENYEKNIIPIYKKIYDVVASTDKDIHQSEVGRIVGIPSTLTGTNNRKDYIIQEFIDIAEKNGLVKCFKKSNRKIIKPGNPNNIPTHCGDISKKSFASKKEARVNAILRKIIENEYSNKYIIEWQVRFNGYNRYPYDFGIMDKDRNCLVLIEVDGEQHQRRIEFYHPTEQDWEKRQAIDIYKEEIAEGIELPLIRLSNHLEYKPKDLYLHIYECLAYYLE